jgi:hypothetical protein
LVVMPIISIILTLTHNLCWLVWCDIHLN